MKICLRRGRRLPKTTGARHSFVTDCETIARSIGTPIWLDETSTSSATTSSSTGDDNNQPTFHYTPPIAFITFNGDLARVQQILNTPPEQRPTFDVGGCSKWTISHMEASKVPKTIPNPLKHVTTGHRSLWVPGDDKTTITATTTTTKNTTTARSLPEPSGPPRATLVAINLTKPGNLGSIYRNMSCFGVEDLVHVYKSSVAPPLWEDTHRMQQIKALSRGTNEHATRTLVPMDEYVSMLKRSRESTSTCSSNNDVQPSTKRAKLEQVNRPPIVAIETATGAVDITNYRFPKVCSIMVGSEGSGISPKVLRAMIPGYDSFVVIPMHGKHHSLNVSMAAGIALYEYRRQWPTSL